MPLGRGPRVALASGAALAVLAPLGWVWHASLLPDRYDMATMGHPDWGGGPVPADGGHAGGSVAVADLEADDPGRPDVRVDLTVRDEGDRYTVDGTSPGPTIEATQGDLVEVVLRNEDVADGVTLHWHGLDVPNAMDGVAGVTQDAVRPGEEFVYRFVADQTGSYWYHSHQISHEQVQRGLFGALVVRPDDPDPVAADEVALLHRYGGVGTLNGREGVTTLDAEPGDRVRLRVVNTDNGMATLWATGAPVRVLAVDGTEVNRPGELVGTGVPVPAGGRVDLGLTVPGSGARLDFSGGPSLLVGEADPTAPRAPAPSSTLDLLGYGEPTGADLGEPDRRWDYVIDRRPGFLDGRPGLWWTVNGGIYPDVPMFMVEEGDVGVFTIRNDSGDAHPMHLHGHHGLVLSRNGVAATGSPWWVDSLEVGVGETYEVAFVADNPGLWMDHCHNLPHATDGLVAHLMYAGVASSYEVGGASGNRPE